MTRTRLISIAFGAAAALALALVLASELASRGDPAPAAASPALLAGIPQRGNELGRADAPVTLVEYADLQCPFCAEFASSALPELVRDYVRSGRVKLVFRGLAFIGPDSETALRAAVAAGRQNRLWDVVHLLYAEQGAENSGWVDGPLGDLSSRVPQLDVQQLETDTTSPAVAKQIGAFGAAAAADGIQGTPSFLAGRTGAQLEPLSVASLDASSFRPTLDALLAG
jgi:protein-disulfide isomerase